VHILVVRLSSYGRIDLVAVDGPLGRNGGAPAADEVHFSDPDGNTVELKGGFQPR